MLYHTVDTGGPEKVCSIQLAISFTSGLLISPSDLSQLRESVVAIFWARLLSSLPLKDARLRMRITLSRRHSLPGLCRTRCGTPLERFRSGPELAGSEESHQDVIVRLKCSSPFY